MKRTIYFLFLVLFLIVVNSCGKKNDGYTQFPFPNWKIDSTGKYPFSMTAVVQLPSSLKSGLTPRDAMAAFINGESRGNGVIVKIDSAASAFYILIHGTASEQGKITFKYYNIQNLHIYATTPMVDFSVDGSFGTPDKPQVLDLQPVK